jgi:hypothetical protein
MFRRFKFEDEMQRTLACVPTAVRRKLDRIGLKVGLEQWRALAPGERLAICHLPVATDEECDAMAAFVREAVRRGSGSEPKSLPPESRADANPPAHPPPALVANAGALGFDLNEAAWSCLDDEERFALMKLGAGRKPSHDLRDALEEFLAPR